MLPATLQDVTLTASIRLPGSRRVITVTGESNITAAGGQIEQLSLIPKTVEAYHGSMQAMLDANLVVIGPGSLYTSILPNLLVNGIADALRATSAYKIYICNIAIQPGETTDFTVAEHVLALERHIGRGDVSGRAREQRLSDRQRGHHSLRSARAGTSRNFAALRRVLYRSSGL